MFLGQCCGSLTFWYGYGCGSGSSYPFICLRIRMRIREAKNIRILRIRMRIRNTGKSHKEVTIKVFSYYFCLMMEGFGAGSELVANWSGYGSYRSGSWSTTYVPSLCVYKHTQNRGRRWACELGVEEGRSHHLYPTLCFTMMFPLCVCVCSSTCCSRCRCTIKYEVYMQGCA